MAVTALASGSSGMSALSTQLDVIANNLANINTTGFKAFRTNLEDLAYQERQQPGVENGTTNDDPTPAGLYVGLGVRVSNTQQDFSQGNPTQTGRPLDIMIDGDGFLPVQINPDVGGGQGYTRAGNLFVNAEGELVVGSRIGPRLDPPVNVGDIQASQINISAEGVVSTIDANGTPSELGRIQLANFINPQGLEAVGGNVLIESPASGPAIAGDPLTSGLGGIVQNHLEASNVDPVLELVQLIKTQRAFEFNSQSIQAADEALQAIGNLRRS